MQVATKKTKSEAITVRYHELEKGLVAVSATTLTDLKAKLHALRYRGGLLVARDESGNVVGYVSSHRWQKAV